MFSRLFGKRDQHNHSVHHHGQSGSHLNTRYQFFQSDSSQNPSSSPSLSTQDKSPLQQSNGISLVSSGTGLGVKQVNPSLCRILICQDIGDKRKLPLFDTHLIEIPHSFMRMQHPSRSNHSTISGNIKDINSSSSSSSSSSIGNVNGADGTTTQIHPQNYNDKVGDGTLKSRSFQDASHYQNNFVAKSLPNPLINRMSSQSLLRTQRVSSSLSIHELQHHTTPPLSSGNMVKKSPNLDLLGDMMFGTVPLSSKANGSSKIHYFRSPQAQVVITKLFTIPQHFTDFLDEEIIQNQVLSSSSSSIQGLLYVPPKENTPSGRTSKESVSSSPSKTNRTIHETSSLHQQSSSPSILDPSFFRPNNRFQHSQSPYMEEPHFNSSMPLGRKSVDAVDINPKRRTLFSENGYETNLSPTLSSSSRTTLTDTLSASFIRRKTQRFALNDVMYDSDYENQDSPSLEGDASPIQQKKSKRKVVFGIALVVDVTDRSELRDFLFTHFALIERRMDLLRLHSLKAIVNQFYDKSSSLEEQSLWNGTAFFCHGFLLQQHVLLTKRVSEFVDNLCSFFNAPRIPSPLWLNSQTFTSESHMHAKQFSQDIQTWSKLSNLHQTLLSEFITAILTHHLGWTFTIATRMKTSDVQYARDTTLSRKKFSDPKMNWHTPYNTYLAQLTDLYGLIGYHSKATRTIVIGSQKNKALVIMLLRIASYFIRCGEVFEQIQKEEETHLAQNMFLCGNDSQQSSYARTNLNASQILQKIPDRNQPSSLYPAHAILNSFGRSLLLDYSTEYCTGAVLMGLDSTKFDEKQLKQDLVSLSHVFEASGSVCILMDVDKLSCRIFEYDKYSDPDPDIVSLPQQVLVSGLTQPVIVRPVQSSNKVDELLRHLLDLFLMIPSEMSMMFVEDYLQDLYNNVMMIKMKVEEGVSLYSPEMKMIVG